LASFHFATNDECGVIGARDARHVRVAGGVFDSYRDRIAAVTPEDIRRVAMAHLRPDQFRIVVVGQPNSAPIWRSSACTAWSARSGGVEAGNEQTTGGSDEGREARQPSRVQRRVISLDVDSVRYPMERRRARDDRHPGAAPWFRFLPTQARRSQLLVVRQYRYAASGFLYELPAGRLEPGEDPAECAARELKEETGCVADSLVPLVTLYTTPGFTDERIHLFSRRVDPGAAAHEADEFIEVVTIRLSRPFG